MVNCISLADSLPAWAFFGIPVAVGFSIALVQLWWEERAARKLD